MKIGVIGSGSIGANLTRKLAAWYPRGPVGRAAGTADRLACLISVGTVW